MKICVVGLGKIGLPLAVQFATKGHDVVGCDQNSVTVALINQAEAPFPGEDQLEQRLQSVVKSGRLMALEDTASAVSRSEVVVVAVPLFVDQEAQPDFNAMDAATTAIGQGLRPGTLVSYETTLPVGTTRDRLTPALERESGLSAGEEFFVVFSPERVLTGRVFSDLRRYPKLVGGIDMESERRGIQFYEAVLDFDEREDLSRPNGVWSMGSAEAAEMAKLAETTYRDVNIGLVNQFALFAAQTGIDITAVIEACNSQPYSHIHTPGIAVGGHCIPIYPRLYLWNDPAASIVAAARTANLAVPRAWVDYLSERFGTLQNRSAVILGAAYRGGVKETAFSGVFAVKEALEAHGAAVRVHDPLYSDDELLALGLKPYHRGETAELVIVQTDHDEYRFWSTSDVPGAAAVLDGRNALDGSRWREVTMLNIAHSQRTQS